MNMRGYGIVFLLAGIIMFIITFVQWLKILSFRNCKTVIATVTDTKKSNHYSNGRSRTSFSMELAYQVDGADYKRNIACDGEEYRLGANRQVEICYKSRNPKRILLNTPDKHSRGQRILWIITLALLVIGAALLVIPSR